MTIFANAFMRYNILLLINKLNIYETMLLWSFLFVYNVRLKIYRICIDIDFFCFICILK